MCSSRQSGFTLIELLVVMLVIGILLGLVTVKLMPDERATLRDEAGRLALLLENAGLEARTGGHSMAWSYDASGYRFWVKNEYGDWTLMDDPQFRPRALPPDTRVTGASVAAQALNPDEPMLLSATAFPSPFLIRLGNAHANARVVGDGGGTVFAQPDSETGQ